MGDTLPRFKAAVVQAAPVFLDREATIEKALGLVQTAASQGASLIVFPETWVPGYPVWANRLIAYRDDPQGQRLFARLWKNSLEVSSPGVQALCQAARQAEAYVIMGINERESRFGRSTLYNSILFIGPTGRLLGVHRKLMPTHHERIIWGVGDGSGLLVLDTELGRVGGLICWEHWMPLARYSLHSQGEQVHAALWPAPYPAGSLNAETHQAANRVYAHEGRSFVIAACAYLEKASIPPEVGLGAEAERWPDILLNGGSAIFGPFGQYLAGPAYEGEEVLYADLNLEEAVWARQSLDVTGHYGRPDVFKLVINRTPQEPVELSGDRGPGVAIPSVPEETEEKGKG